MADNNPIRLLIAEDRTLLRQAFSIFFKEQMSVEVVGEAADPPEIILLCHQLQPDVILLSSSLPPTSFLHFIGRLHQQNPDTQVVVLSSNTDRTPTEKYLEVGASWVATRGIFASDLLAIICQAYFKH